MKKNMKVRLLCRASKLVEGPLFSTALVSQVFLAVLNCLGVLVFKHRATECGTNLHTTLQPLCHGSLILWSAMQWHAFFRHLLNHRFSNIPFQEVADPLQDRWSGDGMELLSIQWHSSALYVSYLWDWDKKKRPTLLALRPSLVVNGSFVKSAYSCSLLSTLHLAVVW